MSELLLAASMAVAGGVGGALAPLVLARLPEPDDAAEDKITYARLARRRGLAGAYAVLGALGCAAIGWRWSDAPVPVLAAWVVVVVLGVVLADVDLRTRLLPRRLVLPAYPLLLVLAALAAVVADDLGLLVRVGVGWLAVSGGYLLLWVASPRGIGYGDVRLSGVLAIALAMLGWAPLVVGTYAAFLVGAAVGVVVLVRRRPDRTFPFGPSMVLGAWCGALLGGLPASWW
ncbi:prepilin peptidase [Mumia flava]|uniref:prepilin peptidase n=1 Tax=Mumia flava TaxID=1348852 RepID=UPI0012FDED4D|nr:prepilin peptidase [Mumia flava]